MCLKPEQVKGSIRNIAKKNQADARTLMRIFMMERFLERIAASEYKNNFILKGGILVTSMVGVALRSTMDIDTSIRNQDLTLNNVTQIIEKIKNMDIDDGVIFEIKNISKIMDEMEYPGIRFAINAKMGKMITPIKIDISTGDVITPEAIEYHYKLMLEERTINLCSYNLETILAEKFQTILSRGILNTRMRDYYDIRTLMMLYNHNLDNTVLKNAFNETCTQRNSQRLIEEASGIIEMVSADINIQILWKKYQNKYSYAKDISFEEIVQHLKYLSCKISEG